MSKLFNIVCFTGLTLAALTGTAEATKSLRRYQVNQKGDFLLLGQSMGADCHPADMVPPPTVGTIGMCGINLQDPSIDVYWRADSPAAGQATADVTILPSQARTTAALLLPAGATVSRAFLYWAARIDVPTPQKPATWDPQVTLDRQGGFTTVVNADDHYEWFHANPGGNIYIYQSIADVTSIVLAQGQGGYRVSDMETATILNTYNTLNMSAWWMVVFYTRPNDPYRNLALYDGLDYVGDINQNDVPFDVSGYFIPNSGIDGKLGIVGLGGDNINLDDGLKFKGNVLSDAQNPADNFFNSSRSNLGAAVSVAGDLPRLVGGANSSLGLDLDVIDVTSYLAAGDTGGQVDAFTGFQDGYFMTNVITSMVTSTPDFVASTKTAVDLNGATVLPGDIIEYTITVTNSGNDASTGTKLTDVLPAGLTLVPGSIQISAGPNMGAKTEAAGDDEADYVAATHTLTVRLGTGATAMIGGAMAVAATTTVKLKATVDGSALGAIDNQGKITASGQNGAPSADWLTDGNGNGAGSPPTSIFVDQCSVDGQCPMSAPHCVTSSNPNVCVECLSNADCKAPTPTCNLPTNTCGCVPTGPEICGNDLDEDCNNGACECSTDAHCGGAASGKVCNGSNSCIDGCRGMNGNGCPSPMLCTSVNGSIGQCVGCLADSNCGGPESGKICDPVSHACEDGCRGVGGNGCMPGSVCTSVNASIGMCVSCVADADCGDATSGQVCDLNVYQCKPGCRGMGGNGCPAGSVCSSANAAIGACVQCVADADCGNATSAKVCDPDTDTCVDGCRGKGGNGCMPGTVCTSTDLKIGHCVPCLKDADCGNDTSGKVCDPPTKTCKDGCRGTGGNGCPAGSVCTSADASFGKCVPCLKDADCGDAMSGTVCNTVSKTCIPGCRGMNGNGCPDGKTCSSLNGSIGSCGCEKDADCGIASSGRVCDLAKLGCVDGCRGTGGNHCAAGVSCSSTDDTIGSCGCAKDADCGEADSGKVCDATKLVCIDGCRGTGGNTCPSGGACSSSSAEIGTCGGNELVGQGHGIFCSTRPGDDRTNGAPWLFGGALGLLLALRRRRRAA